LVSIVGKALDEWVASRESPVLTKETGAWTDVIGPAAALAGDSRLAAGNNQ
jgi:hypothetical protein